jgi:hypothetical protein
MNFSKVPFRITMLTPESMQKIVDYFSRLTKYSIWGSHPSLVTTTTTTTRNSYSTFFSSNSQVAKSLKDVKLQLRCDARVHKCVFL